MYVLYPNQDVGLQQAGDEPTLQISANSSRTSGFICMAEVSNMLFTEMSPARPCIQSFNHELKIGNEHEKHITATSLNFDHLPFLSC